MMGYSSLIRRWRASLSPFPSRPRGPQAPLLPTHTLRARSAQGHVTVVTTARRAFTHPKSPCPCHFRLSPSHQPTSVLAPPRLSSTMSAPDAAIADGRRCARAGREASTLRSLPPSKTLAGRAPRHRRRARASRASRAGAGAGAAPCALVVRFPSSYFSSFACGSPILQYASRPDLRPYPHGGGGGGDGSD
jgi:hypothetical protein